MKEPYQDGTFACAGGAACQRRAGGLTSSQTTHSRTGSRPEPEMIQHAGGIATRNRRHTTTGVPVLWVARTSASIH